MHAIIENVAEATDLPQVAGTQENNQNRNQPVDAAVGEWERVSQEEAAASEWQPKAVTILVGGPAELAVKPKIQNGVVAVALLRPYARNAEIYEHREDPLFTESIRKVGILTELVVTEDGEVLGGNRRLHEAKRLGLKEVPVKVAVCNTEDEKLLRVLDDNIQRVKTNAELAQEYIERLKVETRAAVLRKVEAGKKAKGQAEGEKFTPPAKKKGKARDKAAEVLNLSGVTAEKGRKVIEAVVKARVQGATEVADELLITFNDKNFDAAFKRAQASKLIAPSTPRKTKTTGAAKAGSAAPIEAVTDNLAINAATIPVEADVGNIAPPAAVDAQEDELDAAARIVTGYIKAVGELEGLLLEQLTADLKANLLRARDDAEDWFACNAAELGEGH